METISNHRISIIIIALLILSWWGILDSLSIIVNTESIKDAAIIYGVARSINGVISVVQSAEISALVGSVHPGELLDPMNDLIERFSTVMSWSLGSLVLQKVLLAVFSSYSFKVIFTLFCVITLCVIHFGNSLTLKNKLWNFNIIATETITYTDIWVKKLSEAPLLSGLDLSLLNVEYGSFLAKSINTFCSKNNLNPYLIASHGHTIFHQPEKNFTLQIGSGAEIATKTAASPTRL